MFKIFQVSIENFEFWLSQTVDFLFSLSTPFFSLLSLSFADSPPLRAQAFRHAAHAPAAALSRYLPPCSMPGLECSPARSPLTPLLPRSSAHAPGHALPPARTTPSPPEPPRHYCPAARPCHDASLPSSRTPLTSGARGMRLLPLRDAAVATSEPSRHRAFTPRPSPAELPPSLNALPRRRSSIPAPLPSLS